MEMGWEIEKIVRTDEQWRMVLHGWSDVDLLDAYQSLMQYVARDEAGVENVGHALWSMRGALLERMGSQAQWVDGYTSALANAVEADYIDDEQYDDLYSEVLTIG